MHTQILEFERKWKESQVAGRSGLSSLCTNYDWIGTILEFFNTLAYRKPYYNISKYTVFLKSFQ